MCAGRCSRRIWAVPQPTKKLGCLVALLHVHMLLRIVSRAAHHERVLSPDGLHVALLAAYSRATSPWHHRWPVCVQACFERFDRLWKEEASPATVHHCAPRGGSQAAELRAMAGGARRHRERTPFEHADQVHREASDPVVGPHWNLAPSRLSHEPKSLLHRCFCMTMMAAILKLCQPLISKRCDCIRSPGVCCP